MGERNSFLGLLKLFWAQLEKGCVMANLWKGLGLQLSWKQIKRPVTGTSLKERTWAPSTLGCQLHSVTDVDTAHLQLTQTLLIHRNG